MKTYSILFTGKVPGAIGAPQKLERRVYATTEENAVRVLYGLGYEVGRHQVKEIDPPFDSTSLENFCKNDSYTFTELERQARWFLSAMRSARKKVSAENKAWHDDPAAADYHLYHADEMSQFPEPVLLAAALQMFIHFLRVERESAGFELRVQDPTLTVKPFNATE